MCSLTTSGAAISWLDSPPAISLSTSSSRGVSFAIKGGTCFQVDLRADFAISRRVTDGANIEPPTAGSRNTQRLVDVLVEVESGHDDQRRGCEPARMRRVASRPSGVGIRISMSTTSGRIAVAGFHGLVDARDSVCREWRDSTSHAPS